MSRYENHGPVNCTTPIDLSQVRGKGAIVTGGASGIGQGYVEALVQAGAYVTIANLNPTRGAAIVASSNGHAQFIHCDVTSWRSQANMFVAAQAFSPTRTISIVVANAGIGCPDALLKLEEPGSEPQCPDLGMINVNLIGAIYTAKLAMHYFQLREGEADRDRCLVLQNSLASYVDLPGMPQYTTAKQGLRGLMRVLRYQTILPGMRTNLICPCFIETPLLDDMMMLALRTAGVGIGTVEDCAKALLRIVADRSINGRALAVLPDDMVPGGVYDLNLDDVDRETVEGAYEEQILHLFKP